MFAEMTEFELRIAIGNAAYQLWRKLDSPKPDYNDWYYGQRLQSFSDLESCPRRCVMENPDGQAQK